MRGSNRVHSMPWGRGTAAGAERGRQTDVLDSFTDSNRASVTFILSR